jgi:beta-lactam-binding protein with PASTA domain
MPELRNISQRQAEAKLRALGMQVGQVKYEPSAFKNIVMDLRMDSTSILAGAYVPEGSVIDLYVGRGPGAQKVKVPNVIGKTLTEARSILIGQELSVGRVEYDERPTAETWGKQVVYSQTPEEGAVLTGGGYVSLKLSIDPEKSVVSSSTETEGDEFF